MPLLAKVLIVTAILALDIAIALYAGKVCGFNDRPVTPKDRRKRDAMLTPFFDSQD